MRHSLRRAAAGALCALLLAAAIVRGGGSAGRAAEEILIGQTEPAGEAPRYLLVRPFDDSAWSDSWNDLHYVYPQGRPGERYAAYCLESHRTSPAGQIYREIERPDYSASAERGLKAIFRLGYPYRSAFARSIRITAMCAPRIPMPRGVFSKPPCGCFTRRRPATRRPSGCRLPSYRRASRRFRGKTALTR